MIANQNNEEAVESAYGSKMESINDDRALRFSKRNSISKKQGMDLKTPSKHKRHQSSQKQLDNSILQASINSDLKDDNILDAEESKIANRKPILRETPKAGDFNVQLKMKGKDEEILTKV